MGSNTTHASSQALGNLERLTPDPGFMKSQSNSQR